MSERNELKGKRGLLRLRNAIAYSWDGLRAAYKDEEAFRQVVWEVVAGVPLAIWLGEEWAKDMGSALQLPCQIFILVVWNSWGIRRVI